MELFLISKVKLHIIFFSSIKRHVLFVKLSLILNADADMVSFMCVFSLHEKNISF